VPNYLGFMAQLAADYTPSTVLHINSRLYYNRIAQDNNRYDDGNYDSFDNPLVPGSFHMRNTGINSGLSVQPKYDFGRAGSVTLGISGEWESWTDSGAAKPGGFVYKITPGQGAGSPPYTLYPVSDHYNVYVCSTAIEYEVSLLK